MAKKTKRLPNSNPRSTTYTVEYTVAGSQGPLRNWYGRFATKADAEAYLAQTAPSGGRVVPYPAKRSTR
jgi:hypothetical protein